MDGLLDTLRRTAETRGLLTPATPLDFGFAVHLVRNMPYHRASDRRPETIAREWRGTCSGKHYLLDAIAPGLRTPSQLYHGICRLTRANATHLPDDLRALIPEDGMPDIHTYMRAYIGDRWIVIDATWPTALAQFGFPVATAWDGVSDMPLALEVEDEFPVRGDPQAMKEQLLAEHVGPHAAARDRYILGLTAWLAELVPA